jgi:hypothetical protein
MTYDARLTYDSQWIATCPRCDAVVKPDSQGLCRNCGKGEILAAFIDGYNFFGCSNRRCKQSYYAPKCPSCRARINLVRRPALPIVIQVLALLAAVLVAVNLFYKA